MTLHPRLLRNAAATAAVTLVAVAALALAGPAVSSQSAASHSSRDHSQQAYAAKSGACHITQRHSIASPTKTTIRFVNHDSGPVGVYWLNYQGFLVFYETIARNASFNQVTYRSNAWVMLSSSFNCVGYVVTSGAPKYVIK